MNIVFIIRSLNVGGAERQLLLLAKGLVARGHKIKIITYYKGILDPELNNSGVEITNLQKTSHLGFFKFLYKLICEIQKFKPNVIHGYLSTGNLLATFSEVFYPRAKVIWGIRSSNMKLKNYHFLEKVIFAISRVFSFTVDLIIYNSLRGKEFHSKKYFGSRHLVIPNGIDVDTFQISESDGKFFREEFNLQNEYLIGCVSRIDYIKDYPFFLNILKELKRREFPFKAVCIGTGDAQFKSGIKNLCTRLGLDESVLWIDHYKPLLNAYNAFDVLCLTSYSEGFPNVICEAMACGTPCYAAFEAGEAPFLLENSNYIFLNRSPKEAADKIIVNSKRKNPKDKTRSKITEKYSIEVLIDTSEKAFRDLAQN